MVLLAKILNDAYKNQKEKILEKELKLQSSNKSFKSTSSSSSFSMGFVVLYFLCGIAAAYFSWKHNSKIGWTSGYKFLYATFAFLCPFEYVSIYLTYKSDILKYMERTKTEFVEIIPTPNKK